MNRFPLFLIRLSLLGSVIMGLSSGSLFSQSRPLRFKTNAGHIIKINAGALSYDDKVLLRLKYSEDIISDSKLNQVIEDHDIIFLFLAMNGRPNLDRYNVYKITPNSATLVADAILSPVKDYDHDGYLEFGGRDLTEVYPNRDSMYYIPTAYFEIRNGTIQPDLTLTMQKDKEINGLYLPINKQLDKHGYCCVVIPNPKKK